MSWHLKSYGSLIDVVEALAATLSPHFYRLAPLGLLPMKSRTTPEIRILATPKVATSSLLNPAEAQAEEKVKLLQNLENIRHVEGESYQFCFKGALYPFKLMLSTQGAWYARLVQTSSYSDLHITLATAAKNMGLKWVPSRGGYEILKTGEMRLARSEEEVFDLVRIPYIPPEKRHLWPVFVTKESGLPPIISKEEMRDWVTSVPWTDTTCGGEYHQYTFRTSGDEQTFVHIVECIRELGYDGRYLRRKWRYLDLDGMCYFSWGSPVETTALINRKSLRQEETPWAKNPELWIPQLQMKEACET